MKQKSINLWTLAFALLFGAVLIFSFASCTGKSAESHTYETDDTTFKNGEILLPDYVHKDTLIVTGASLLNEYMADYDAESDGDIRDILRVGTMKYSKNN